MARPSDRRGGEPRIRWNPGPGFVGCFGPAPRLLAETQEVGGLVRTWAPRPEARPGFARRPRAGRPVPAPEFRPAPSDSARLSSTASPRRSALRRHGQRQHPSPPPRTPDHPHLSPCTALPPTRCRSGGGSSSEAGRTRDSPASGPGPRRCRGRPGTSRGARADARQGCRRTWHRRPGPGADRRMERSVVDGHPPSHGRREYQPRIPAADAAINPRMAATLRIQARVLAPAWLHRAKIPLDPRNLAIDETRQTGRGVIGPRPLSRRRRGRRIGCPSSILGITGRFQRPGWTIRSIPAAASPRRLPRGGDNPYRPAGRGSDRRDRTASALPATRRAGHLPGRSGAAGRWPTGSSRRRSAARSVAGARDDHDAGTDAVAVRRRPFERAASGNGRPGSGCAGRPAVRSGRRPARRRGRRCRGRRPPARDPGGGARTAARPASDTSRRRPSAPPRRSWMGIV